MRKVRLNTEYTDGNYMDIGSIDFEYDEKLFKKQIDTAVEVLKENTIFNSISLSLVANDAIKTTNTYKSEVGEGCNSTDVDFRINTEYITIQLTGSKPYLYYRAWSKRTSDFLEVNLNSLL